VPDREEPSVARRTVGATARRAVLSPDLHAAREAAAIRTLPSTSLFF
jgi:hypothetical protein